MDVHDVKRLAQIAQITVSDEEAEALLSDLTATLAYIDQVVQAPLPKTEEAVAGEIYNAAREDLVKNIPGTQTDVLLAQVPQTQDGFVKVNKIL